jgi:hypothetical protein
LQRPVCSIIYREIWQSGLGVHNRARTYYNTPLYFLTPCINAIVCLLDQGDLGKSIYGRITKNVCHLEPFPKPKLVGPQHYFLSSHVVGFSFPVVRICVWGKSIFRVTERLPSSFSILSTWHDTVQPPYLLKPRPRHHPYLSQTHTTGSPGRRQRSMLIVVHHEVNIISVGDKIRVLTGRL